MAMKQKGPPDDPALEAQLDRAFALVACQDLVPPEMIPVFREFLRDVLLTHPVGSTLLDRVRPRPAPLESGDMPKPGRLAYPEPDALPKKSQGGGRT